MNDGISRIRQRRDENIEKGEVRHQLLDTPHARTLIEQWDKEQYAKIDDIYNDDESLLSYTDPPRYENSQKAMEALKKKKIQYEVNQDSGGKTGKLDTAVVVEILRSTVAFTVDTANASNPSLLTYDYDNHVYVYGDSIVNEYVVTLMGSASRSQLQTIVTSLIGRRRELAAFVPLPNYKIAVGNGIYNCLTRKLEDNDPRYIVTEKINTNYIPHDEYDPHTAIGRGRTFSSVCADLANFEPDRIQLLHQICKSVITGHSIAPAMFVVVGRGGDGKSTFFQLLVNTVGVNNSAFVNFNELEQADKMAETVNKKLVLGMDNNVNEYIRKTALLKSISAHEYITHSRKYERAISVRFSGAFVQLCNEMPRFMETGDSMLRRIVCFHAENSHYRSGTEDRTITQLIEQRDFQEHTLSQILNESTCGFYRDFNDIDRGIVKATLDNEDVLSQFVAEMNNVGALSETNERIPVTHLHGIYRDWVRITNPNARSLSYTTFAQRIAKPMDMFGYELSSSISGIQPSALEKTGVYSPELFSTYAHGNSIDEVRERNTTSAVFERTHEPITASMRRRGAQRCSAVEFFNHYTEFVDWVQGKDEDLFNALNDPLELGPQYDSSITVSDGVSLSTDKASEKLEESRRQQEEEQKFKALLESPNDLRGVYQHNDRRGLEEHRRWVEGLSTVTAATQDHKILLTAAIDGCSSRLMQIATMEHDAELAGLAESAQSRTGQSAIKYITNFIDLIATKMKDK